MERTSAPGEVEGFVAGVAGAAEDARDAVRQGQHLLTAPQEHLLSQELPQVRHL